jgi:hypothetical protein
MFNNLKQSFNPISTTTKWSQTDKEETFNLNLKKHKNNETLSFYLENPIEYQFNNFGFRTPDDFNDVDDGNVFLGCSHTMGVGHHLDNTWSYKLNQQVGGKFWNISAGGIGIMTNFRLLLAFYKDLKIKNIFHYVPKYPRYEFYVDGRFKILNIGKDDIPDECVNLLGDLYQIELTHLPYTMAINQLAQDIGCNYYLINDFIPNKLSKSIESRDLFHFSIDQHNQIYEKFLDKFNKKEVMKPNFEKKIL